MAKYKNRVNLPAISIFMVALMMLSGCIGLADSEDENSEPLSLEPFLGDQIKRSLGAPDLEIFDDCASSESALKMTIEEEICDFSSTGC